MSEGRAIRTIKVSIVEHRTKKNRTYSVCRRQAVVNEHGQDTSHLEQRRGHAGRQEAGEQGSFKSP